MPRSEGKTKKRQGPSMDSNLDQYKEGLLEWTS